MITKGIYSATCSILNEDYSLKYFINHKQVNDIRKYVVMEEDRILISYGNEDQDAIEKQLSELDSQMINR